jgi:hypothetical protein
MLCYRKIYYCIVEADTYSWTQNTSYSATTTPV